MIHAYAFKADTAPLKAAGADHVWYDADSKRLERAAMMKGGALRPGDTLLLLSLHNLAGSPRSYDRWRADLDARGVSIRIVETPDKPRPAGRPRKYDPSPAKAQRDWAIWTDGHRSEHDRIADIACDGSHVTRQILNGRYGNPTNPKPAPV